MPFASLVAVRGRQHVVVTIRLVECIATLGLLVVALELPSAATWWAPYLLALGSFVDGLVIRLLVIPIEMKRASRSGDQSLHGAPGRGSRVMTVRGSGALPQRRPALEAGGSARPPQVIRTPVGFGMVMLVCVMVLVSVLSWRTVTYYSGGLDPVVFAKSVLGFAAFCLAVSSWRRSGRAWFCGVRTVTIVTLYLCVSVIGAAADGAAFASGVIAIRVMLLLATLVFLLQSTSARTLVNAMGWSCGSWRSSAPLPASGQHSAASDSRACCCPSSEPLAIMFGASLLVGIWLLTTARASPRLGMVVAILLGLIWLTGSRTGLLAALAAIAVLLLVAGRLPVGIFAALCAAVPTAFYLITYTGLLEQFFARGGEANVTTLSSRTIAWHAAFQNRPRLLAGPLRSGLGCEDGRRLRCVLEHPGPGQQLGVRIRPRWIRGTGPSRPLGPRDGLGHGPDGTGRSAAVGRVCGVLPGVELHRERPARRVRLVHPDGRDVVGE